MLLRGAIRVKKSIFLCLLFIFCLSFNNETTANAQFKDVNPNTEQGQAISELIESGAIKGYADNTFRPNQKITRAQVVSVLNKHLNIPIRTFGFDLFKDVTMDHPQYFEIEALASFGIINGFNGYFKPSEPITRGQLSKILARTYNLTGETPYPFKDVKKSSYEKEIVALYANEIIQGKSQTYFGVNDNVTRGQMALLMYRINKNKEQNKLDLEVSKSFSHTGELTLSRDHFKEINYKLQVGTFKFLGEGKVELQNAGAGKYEEVTITPKAEGTTYIEFSDQAVGTEGGVKIYKKSYRVDIEKVDNQFVMHFTPLENEVFEPVYFGIPSNIKTITIQDSNGRDISPDQYAMKQYENQLHLIFKGQPGTYKIFAQDSKGNQIVWRLEFAHYENANFNVNYDLSKVVTAKEVTYTPEELYVKDHYGNVPFITSSNIKSVSVKDSYAANFNASVTSNGIAVKFSGDGLATIEIKLTTGKTHEINIRTFNQGDYYLID